jgi:predicted transcriptional regulator
MKKHKYEIAVDLLREGLSRKAVAERMGATMTHVVNYIAFARKHGISITSAEKHELLQRLLPEVAAWLQQQTPKGATMGDVICAILVDAYNDEMEKQPPHGAERGVNGMGDMIDIEQAFLIDVIAALKADASDLGKEARILNAFRKAVAALAALKGGAECE